jgi:hypothetical protein
VTRIGIALAGAALTWGTWIAACSAPEPPRRVEPVRVAPTPVPKPDYFVHTIEFRGQTLGRIARWYTGDFENWKKLVSPVNPDLTVCCAPLRVGREVSIPRELVVRTDPMPKPVTRPAPPLQKRDAPATPAPTQAQDASAESIEEPAAEPTKEPTKAPTPAPTEAAEEDDPLEIIGPR